MEQINEIKLMGELIMKKEIKKEIKEEIMGYLESIINEFGDLMEFVVELKEEISSDGEAIYVKRIVELEAENEELKTEYLNLEKDYINVYTENEELKDAQSITLSTNNEMSSALWNSVCSKLTIENEKLVKRNEMLEKEFIKLDI